MLTHLDDFSRTLKIERNYSNNTISSYLSDLKSFDSFLEKNRINFKELNNKHTKLFFRNLSKKKFSPRTIKRKFLLTLVFYWIEELLKIILYMVSLLQKFQKYYQKF